MTNSLTTDDVIEHKQSNHNPTQVVPINPDDHNTLDDPLMDNLESQYSLMNDLTLRKAYSLSRIVKIFALINFVFSVLYAMYNPWFFIPIIFSIMGYKGATSYSICYATAYMFYVIANAAARLGVFIYLFMELPQVQQGKHVFDFIVVIVGFLISSWVSKINYTFIKSIIDMTELERNILLNNNYNGKRVIILW